MTIIVGITGGIASGKSTIANYIKSIKMDIHESDYVIKKIYEKPIKRFISYLKKVGIGEAIKKDTINKNKVREIIFNNTTKKKSLEKYLHNEVKKDRTRFIKKHKSKNKKIIFLDIPLLFENNLDKMCDFVICIYAPLYVRKKRALKRRGINNKIFKLIVKNQISDIRKRKMSNFVIKTTKSKQKTFEDLNKIINKIIKK